MIVDRDILNNIGLTLCFAEKTMQWMDSIVLMKTDDFWNTPLLYYWALDDNDDEFDFFATTKIMDAKYEKVEIDNVIKAQKHLEHDYVRE